MCPDKYLGETPESVQPVASEPQTQPELEQQEGIEQKEPPKEPPKEEFGMLSTPALYSDSVADPYSVKIPRVVVKTSENEDPEVRRKREAIRNVRERKLCDENWANLLPGVYSCLWWLRETLHGPR